MNNIYLTKAALWFAAVCLVYQPLQARRSWADDQCPDGSCDCAEVEGPCRSDDPSIPYYDTLPANPQPVSQRLTPRIPIMNVSYQIDPLSYSGGLVNDGATQIVRVTPMRTTHWEMPLEFYYAEDIIGPFGLPYINVPYKISVTDSQGLEIAGGDELCVRKENKMVCRNPVWLPLRGVSGLDFSHPLTLTAKVLYSSGQTREFTVTVELAFWLYLP